MSKTELDKGGEQFNLLKRVILLEERTRSFEESQVRLSFLEQRVEELTEHPSPTKQTLLYELEKSMVMLDDKVQSFENKYGKVIEQIHTEIQHHLEPDFSQEIAQLQELIQRTDQQATQRLAQLKEDIEKSIFQLQKTTKDTQIAYDRQAYQIQELQRCSDTMSDPRQSDPRQSDPRYLEPRQSDVIQPRESKRTEQHQSAEQARVNQKECEGRENTLVPRMLSFNKETASKSSLSYQPYDKQLVIQPLSSTFKQSQHQIKQKEDEIELLKQKQSQLKEAPRDLSGFRAATRSNPYKQRDLTNVRERQTPNAPQEVRWDTEIKFEQTKRFIDDEINRRIKEEKDKKQAQDQKHLTYTSLRDQLNLQYQKKYF